MIAGSARWNKKGRHIWTINFVDIANITDVKKVINTSVKTGNQGSLIRTPHHSRDAAIFRLKNILLVYCEFLQDETDTKKCEEAGNVKWVMKPVLKKN